MAINISLSKLPWYGQVGVFVLLGAGSAFAFWNYYAKPTNAAIETRQATLAQIRLDINRGLTTARRLPEFRKEVATLEIQLDRLRAVLPEEQDVADLLKRVNSMATQSNLKVLGFIPRATTKKQLHTEWPLGLQLEGTYHDLGLFLDRVSKLPRIINVADMRVKAREAQSTRATVTVDVTAATFVLAEQPKAPAPVKPGGA
jgi:type IV pilus assembly protein PilO